MLYILELSKKIERDFVFEIIDRFLSALGGLGNFS